MAGALQLRQFFNLFVDLVVYRWAAGDLRVMAIGPKGNSFPKTL
jgi:hypothetical protein